MKTLVACMLAIALLVGTVGIVGYAGDLSDYTDCGLHICQCFIDLFTRNRPPPPPPRSGGGSSWNANPTSRFNW